MRKLPARIRVAAPLLVAVALLVSGCAPTSSTPSSGAATSTPSPTSTAGGGQVDPNAPAGQCADGALEVAVTPAEGGGGAGSQFFSVDFTNTGAASCMLRGAPGVSIVGDGNGTQLGSPATQTDDLIGTVSLAPGQTVGAPLQLTNIGTDGGPLAGSCTVVTGDGYRVYPPHSFTAFSVPSAGITACSTAVDWMSVGPVAAG